MTQPESVSRAEFARQIGRARSWVTKLAQAGRLVLTDDGKRVRVAESLRLIGQTEGTRSDVADRHAEARGGESPHTLESARKLKAISEARRLAAIAEKEEMERDKMAGALLAREDVDFVLKDFGATLRALLETLPDRLAPRVYPLTTLDETHAVLREEAEDILREMAETMRRRREHLGGAA